MARYTLTTRISGKVEHDRFDELDAAVDALERRGHALQGRADAESVGGSLMRRYEPAQQVTARLEVSGRRVRAGVDIRGNGDAVPFIGRLLRKQITQIGDESAYDAVRRTVAE